MRALFAKHRAESRILLIFLALSGGLLLLGKAASEVIEGDTLAFDRAVLLFLRNSSDPAIPIGPLWLRQVMVDVTALGSVAVLTIITTLAAGYLVAAKKPMLASFMVGAVAGGALISTLLKQAYARARPDIVAHLVGTDSASFPSGHAMNSAVTFLTLAVLLARAEKSVAVRRYLISIAIGLTLVIGFSRLYLGVHWPTDVAAGWIVGALWAAGCSLWAKRLQSHHTIEEAGTSP
ncbi:MAG TPA: phosphatase PAP2 family protein [Croceibacterium sp.]|nr:phosphatase PAP2 family protein [Croceibacterium sp.]